MQIFAPPPPPGGPKKFSVLNVHFFWHRLYKFQTACLAFGLSNIIWHTYIEPYNLMTFITLMSKYTYRLKKFPECISGSSGKDNVCNNRMDSKFTCKISNNMIVLSFQKSYQNVNFQTSWEPLSQMDPHEYWWLRPNILTTRSCGRHN